MRDIVFLHPDLGIGGAERAVIDMALALKSRGHRVHMVTAHHDRGHCFEETRDGRLNVTCVGDWLPRSLFGRCRALCAYLRMIYAALYLVFFSELTFDVILCDQISACIPFLRCRCRSSVKILFYCHFPDLLLTGRKNMLKRLYRAPIDWLEEITTGMADCVLVNSHFTAEIFKNTFSSLKDMKPGVLYPVPDCFNSSVTAENSVQGDLIPSSAKVIFLSINRYERKKNLGLALEALSLLRDKLPSSTDFSEVHLVIAGGYDDLVDENREYHKELVELMSKLDLENNVTFLRNVTASQKHSLMTQATCLLYTPDNEHFGIVPVEAMYCQCPVIAVNSGGPRETVVNGQTGFLCNNTPADFADAMLRFTGTSGGMELKKKFGEAGRRRVQECFSFEAFTEKLDTIVCSMCSE